MADVGRVTRSGRILVVEDEYVVAADLVRFLEAKGLEVVGPAGSVQDALEIAAREVGRLDGAILDINLDGERVFPVADELIAQGVPLIFLTGYDALVIPEAYAAVPRHDKPFDRARLLRWVADAAP